MGCLGTAATKELTPSGCIEPDAHAFWPSGQAGRCSHARRNRVGRADHERNGGDDEPAGADTGERNGGWPARHFGFRVDFKPSYVGPCASKLDCSFSDRNCGYGKFRIAGANGRTVRSANAGSVGAERGLHPFLDDERSRLRADERREPGFFHFGASAFRSFHVGRPAGCHALGRH